MMRSARTLENNVDTAGCQRAIPGSRPPSKRRRAAAATELAITLPLLVGLAFGCAELGRAVATYIAVGNAASVGARYGATHGYTSYTFSSWQQQIIQQAEAEIEGNGSLDASRLSVNVSTTADPAGLYLTTVTANYRFDTITSWPGIGGEFTISRSVGMRRFR